MPATSPHIRIEGDMIQRYDQTLDPHLKFNEGKPCIIDIPKSSQVCIVSLPSRREVMTTKASGSFTPSELDPGKYAYTIHKYPLFNNPQRGWSWRGEFLVDVTEQEYQRLLFITPRFAKGISTTQGARWDCGIAQCNESFTSIIGAIQHEGEHVGIDYIHAPMDDIENAMIKAVADKKIDVKDAGVPVESLRQRMPIEPA